MLLSMSVMAGATSGSSDISGHWAEKTLQTWIDNGLLKGSNGNYNPNGEITRAEFMTLVNRLYKYSEESTSASNYTDVSPESWYFSEVAKALAAGYIKGSSETLIAPESSITREQVFAIAARIEGLDENNANTDILKGSKDSGSISSWAKAAVCAVVRNGYATGSNGYLKPLSNITRAEAIVLLDRVSNNTRIYGFAGTYGSAGTTTIVGDATITSTGVTLLNTEITGNLKIAESVGDGDVHLDNVKVNGNIDVNGGGENSVYFANVTVLGSVVVARDDDGVVRIVASGNTNVKAVILDSGAVLVTQEISGGGIEQVFIPADYFGDNPIQLIGNFNTVTNQNANAQIVMADARITSLNLEAAANITGTGSIKTANISQEASDSALPVKPEEILGDGANDVKIAGGTVSPSTNTGTDPSSGPKTTHYTVTFNLNGKTGTAIASQSVADGGYAIVPSTSPSAAGYIFEGWYTDAAGTTAFAFTTTAIKGHTTIYAKWSTTVALLCDALTFDLIKGSNENEQSITDDLSLITSLDSATISWSSTDTTHLSGTGTVTRPSDDDIRVTLTATITYGGETATKDFELIIRNENIDSVTVDYIDEYFEDGYPYATIENGEVVVYCKLVKAAEVYITADTSNATDWDSSVKGVLEGHADTYDGETDPTASVYVNCWDYENVSDTSTIVSFNTGVSPVSGNKLKVNLVIRDDTYTSSAVTTIEFDIATATAADTTPPDFYMAFINSTDDKIYLYGHDQLDLSSEPATDDFSITNELGEPSAEVTGVSINNSGGWPESWIELSIENTSSSSLYVSYEPGTNEIQDEMGNACTGFSDVPAESAQTDIGYVSVNLEAGTMKIYFAPGFNSIGDMNITASDFTVTNDGAALTNLKRTGGAYNPSYYSAKFTFDPVTSY